MGLNISRSVKIEITNNTQNIILRNPRTYFYSGRSLNSLEPSMPPGSSSTCEFKNHNWFWGCNGILAIEAESFTLAIYFSNPIHSNLFSVKTGLELSLDRVHRVDLEGAYKRLVRASRTLSNQNCIFPAVILRESRERAQLSAGPVKVTATMNRGQNTVIKVKVEDQRNRGSEDRRGNLC